MHNLNNINSPNDLKHLNIDELKILAKEIRGFLLRSVSKIGGHLASNLGTVELTLALHYCLNSPKDKIIWDVGHQAYTHKILTGRKNDFKHLRMINGMSGYLKNSESPHDIFDAGHSSTSLSAAFGFSSARDILSSKGHVVAIIGDGSLTSGLALEGLNNIGRCKTNTIVILNDNQMSISENVGALSRYLNDLRTTSSYINIKKDIDNILSNLSIAGVVAKSMLKKTKDQLRYLLLPGTLFKELGFKYYGPIDGHNIRSLVNTINSIKKIDGPILLHVQTTKGKGYKFAENAPLKYHGVEPFDIKTGEFHKKAKKTTYTDVFGKKMLELGQKNPKIVAITASMPTGTGLVGFKERFDSRFFDVGIAESHAVTFAAGLAKSGLRPVVAIYSTFLQRSYDQILHDVCIQNLPVVFALDRAGVVPADGETHQGVFDLSYLCSMPNMTILAPRNAYELENMLEFAVNHASPCAVRYPKDAVSQAYENIAEPITYAKSEVLEYGKDIAIISVGSMFEQAHDVYNMLCTTGYKPSLINARFVKPLCQNMLNELKSCKYIFTMEENSIIGGFGSYLLQQLTHMGINSKIIRNFGISDSFIPQGNRSQLFKSLGLDCESIYKAIIDTIKGTNGANNAINQTF